MRVRRCSSVDSRSSTVVSGDCSSSASGTRLAISPRRRRSPRAARTGRRGRGSSSGRAARGRRRPRAGSRTGSTPRPAAVSGAPAAPITRSISATGSMTESSRSRMTGHLLTQTFARAVRFRRRRTVFCAPPRDRPRQAGRSRARNRLRRSAGATAPAARLRPASPSAGAPCSRSRCRPARRAGCAGCGSAKVSMKWLIACSPMEPQWLVLVTSTPRPERISMRAPGPAWRRGRAPAAGGPGRRAAARPSASSR